MARQTSLSHERWAHISTVLLDMDGTLLDLNFDNHFWLEHIPNLFAEKEKISIDSANDHLKALYQKYQGTLNWYCTDFWSDKLELDIISIKRTLAQGVKIRPGTLEFLKLCQLYNKHLIILTNAHPDTLRIKLDSVQIGHYFARIISSHQVRAAKESSKFWQTMVKEYAIDLESALFVDDSEVILDAAATAGVGLAITISQPDLSLQQRENLRYPAVNKLVELFPDDMAIKA